MSIITTFESQCRALTSTPSPDDNASRFLVGTQSPITSENLLYFFEYKDDNNSLAKVSFKFPFGEVWHLSSSSKFPKLVTGVVSKDGKAKVSLFSLPQELENPIEDDYGLSESPINKLFDLAEEESKSGQVILTKQCHWHPDGNEQLLICHDGSLEFWDINQRKNVSTFNLLSVAGFSSGLKDQIVEEDNTISIKPKHISELRWSSLFNCSVVAAAIGPKIFGIDTRIPDTNSSSICWLIEDNRCNRVRSIDFNPNSQYYLASGGDDCRVNFWDLRNTSSPSLHLQAHSHWIWSVRYNPFHDQLVLSAGSDARVALMRAESVASEPFGQMVTFEDEEEEDDDGGKSDLDRGDDDDVVVDNLDKHVSSDKKSQNEAVDKNVLQDTPNKNREHRQLKDEVINVYEEHDDSVYAAEWATDPWIFASLGYESRLVINKVPKKEKFNILF